MKKGFYFSFLFFLLVLVSCSSDKKSTRDLLTLVPKKTAIIVKTNNYSKLKKEIQDNSFLKANADLPIAEFFKTTDSRISRLNISNKSLFCFSKVGQHVKTTIITAATPHILDSINTENLSDYQYNNVKIKKYTSDKETYYGVELDGLFVFGNSKLVIENIVRLSKENVELSESFQKIYKASSSENSIFINPSEFQKAYDLLMPQGSSSFLDKLSNWIALDFNIDENSFTFNGITAPKRNEVLGIFRKINPQENLLASITPLGATGFYSFTYDDFEMLKDNLSYFRKKDYPKLKYDFLQEIDEVGDIYVRNSSAVALRSINTPKTKETLATQGKIVETHRGHQVFTFEEPNYFYNAFYPLVKTLNVHYYSQIDDFFIFSKDLSTIEYIIANSQNKTVLINDETYLNSVNQLSNKSSILAVGVSNNLIKNISKNVAGKYSDSYLNTTIANYKYSVMQFIHNDDYTYVNGLFSDAGKTKAKEKGGIQVASIKPGEDIVGGPWFFINWRTKQYDIIIEGESNTLYAYDNQGHLRWKKEIDGQILGDIEPIDIFNNHRIQMAFATTNTFYIIDRNGEIVKPFNKQFDKPITQPLAVFDYNHNGDFRFIITQDNQISMFDKNLKPVKGFEFYSAKSSITQTPKHIRIGTKDYILIPEKSGKLHILNPRGQTRVAVNQNIDFSDNEWYLYNGHFSSTDKEGRLVEIDQKGGIVKTNLGLNTHHKIDATAHTLVSFSENKLTIKGKTTKLDYGLYTAPKIFYINNKIYVSITDKQAHKVYLFDSNSNLFSGFPVYGNSTIDLNNMDNHGGLELLVKGEGDSVLIYEVK